MQVAVTEWSGVERVQACGGARVCRERERGPIVRREVRGSSEAARFAERRFRTAPWRHRPARRPRPPRRLSVPAAARLLQHKHKHKNSEAELRIDS